MNKNEIGTFRKYARDTKSLIDDIEQIRRAKLAEFITRASKICGRRYVAEKTGFPYSALSQYARAEVRRVSTERLALAVIKLTDAMEKDDILKERD